MNKQHIIRALFCLLLGLICEVSYGQYEQRSTLGMSGSSNEVQLGDKTFHVSSSVGQQGVIGTIGTDAITMRQGFQQPPIRVISVTGTNSTLEVGVFPNPVDALVTVTFGTSISNDILSVLYDIQGRDIARKIISPTQSFQVDMSQLAAGTYLLKVRVKEQMFTTRLIKN